MFVPKRMFLTKGVGKHREKLTSFELALRSAGIAACNLVRVSSIFPPRCKLVSRDKGVKELKPGQVTFVVMSENSTREPHRLIAASVGVAIPADRNTFGYLSEHHSFGQTEVVAGEYAEELAAEMLAATLGVEVAPDRGNYGQDQSCEQTRDPVRAHPAPHHRSPEKRRGAARQNAGHLFPGPEPGHRLSNLAANAGRSRDDHDGHVGSDGPGGDATT